MAPTAVALGYRGRLREASTHQSRCAILRLGAVPPRRIVPRDADVQPVYVTEPGALVDSGAGFLATVDADFNLELEPFLDRKAGLLIRWRRQPEISSVSATTLFFLPGGTLERVLDHGSRSDRDELLHTADGMRGARAADVRDLSKPLEPHQVPAVRAEIAAAREDLARLKELCRQMLDATLEAVGPEVMANLRRKILPDYCTE